MNKASFSPLIVAVLLFCGILVIPNKFYVSFVSKHKVEKEAVALNKDMFQGMVIQEKMLKDDKYLPIYGSSELSRLDSFHPYNYFKANYKGFTPFLYGRGGTQSLIQFLNFAVLKNDLENKKIIFVLSPQWFKPGGIDSVHFDPNFSVLQAYQFALHPTVSKDIQEKGAKRLLDFSIVKKDFVLKTLLEEKAYHDPKYKVKANLVKPAANLKLNLLVKRDILLSAYGFEERKIHANPNLTKDLPWNKVEENAMKEAKKRSSNKFHIDNKVFKYNVKPRLKKLKGRDENRSYGVSPEYQDFQMMMDVLKEANADVLVISPPVNGPWYDYTKFPQKGREVYYKKIKKQVEKEGFKFADLSNHEYDRYFLQDSSHLSFKGWVYVDKAIEDFMAN